MVKNIIATTTLQKTSPSLNMNDNDDNTTTTQKKSVYCRSIIKLLPTEFFKLELCAYRFWIFITASMSITLLCAA